MLLVFFIVTVIYIFIKIYKNNKIYILINKYKISRHCYINGVFYKSISKEVVLHIYSRFNNISIDNCEIHYHLRKSKCITYLHHIYRMDKTFFIATIPTFNTLRPKYVILNNLYIKIPSSIKVQYKYLVCARMLFNYTKSNYLIQYYESLKYFGVSKVVSYFTSASQDVIKILSHYVNEGLLDLYKYDEEMEIEWKNVYYGEVGKLNHCFQQYQEVSKFIMEFDYDEILWPIKGYSYNDLFKRLPKKDVFYTHSRFFIINNIISDKDIDMFSINISCQTYNGFVKKYIVSNPLKILALEVHSIAASISKISTAYINPKIAYLRHTRKSNKRIVESCRDYYPNLKSNEINKIKNTIQKVRKKIFKYLVTK